MKYPNILTLTLLLLAGFVSIAQCDFTMTTNPSCGSTLVKLEVVNPDTSGDYNFRFSGGLPKAEGDSVGVYFPGTTTTKTYTVSLYKGNQLCETTPASRKTITIKSAPDANGLTDITGNGNPFTYCSSTTGNPNYTLRVQNNSATKTINTRYVLNWGDGTPQEVYGSSFDIATHTYKSQGYFTLKLTVEGPGLECPSSTVEYSIFNGNIPAGGISSNGNTIGGCAPESYLFNIENTLNNSSGTTYNLYLNGEKIKSYGNPPPSSVLVDFEEHSCGKRGPSGFPNSHLLELEISNQCFTYKVATSPIVLSSPPLPNFDMPTEICIGKPIKFTNTTIGATVSTSGSCDKITNPLWSISPATGWDLVDGCLDGCESITVDFHSPGPWDIKIYLENPCGEDSLTKTITLTPAPIADANALITNPLSCAPIDAQFTNLSQATNPRYVWSVSPANGTTFTGGTTKNSENPKIRFSQAGTYKVELTIPSDCGDAIWDTTITVNGKPQVTLTEILDQCNSLVYTPLATINSGTNVVTDMLWSFPGGVPSTFSGLGVPPVVLYSSPGNYTVTVAATNICGTNDDNDDFAILALGNISAGNDLSVCEGGAPIKLNGQPLGGTWSGTGVVNDTFFIELAGIGQHDLQYKIALQSCSDSAIRRITVNLKPVADGGDTLKICRNAGPALLSGATPVGGTWSGAGVSGGLFNPANVQDDTISLQYIYADPSTGCSDTAQKAVVILPDLNFNTNDTLQICRNKQYAFSQYLNDPSIIGNVSWDFGDGATSGNPNGSHTYSASGVYQVTLSGNTTTGCPININMWVVVSIPVTLAITKTNAACNGGYVTFRAVSNVPGTFSWKFGQGSTSTLAQPLPVYYPPGMYTDTSYIVKLTGYFACDSIVVKDTIKVLRTPVANFGTPTSIGCTPFTTTIANATTGSPAFFQWDFGNGNTSTAQNPPAQTYTNTTTSNKTFTIRLIVGNSCGNDTLAKTITVTPKNVRAAIGADPLSGCPPLQVNFESFSTPGSSAIWNFGNGQSATGDEVEEVFSEPGTYNVQLIARTSCAADTTYTTVKVHPSPDLTFNATSVCLGSPVVFNNTSVNADAFRWEFGNGFISGLKNPSYQYPVAGTYSVSLSGENSYGCRDTIRKDLTIYPQPVAQFKTGPEPVCETVPIVINNTSTNADTYTWNFGDGTNSSSSSPVKAYDEPGIYTIILVAGKAGQCFDTIRKLYAAEILPAPVAAFDYTILSGLNAGTIQFDNQSTNAGDFVWNFGDSTFSTDRDPEHLYASGGRKLVSLLAINPSGCRDSTEEVIDLKIDGEIFIPNAFAPLTAQGIDAGVFKPKGYGLSFYRAEIYSTWGELLWFSEKLENGQPVEGWDGHYKGELMPQDTYIWKITATLRDGSSWDGTPNPGGKTSQMGVVMLLR